jgi:membrane-bound serine protease (ClpP class)
VIVAMTTVTAILMTLVTLAAIRSRRMRTAEGLIGAGLGDNTVGEVRKPLNPIGSVWAGGEEWTARASDQRSLSRGTPVRVLRQEGLTLVVEPAENSVSGA